MAWPHSGSKTTDMAREYEINIKMHYRPTKITIELRGLNKNIKNIKITLVNKTKNISKKVNFGPRKVGDRCIENVVGIFPGNATTGITILFVGLQN